MNTGRYLSCSLWFYSEPIWLRAGAPSLPPWPGPAYWPSVRETLGPRSPAPRQQTMPSARGWFRTDSLRVRPEAKAAPSRCLKCGHYGANQRRASATLYGVDDAFTLPRVTASSAGRPLSPAL
jgi:hypothetical protein